MLRSIKELEFDKAMGKISEADFADISARLRARALALMADLDRQPSPPAKARSSTPVRSVAETTPGLACAACGTANESDARFCKNCGAGLGASA